jgi:hypothetical protein
MGAVPDVALRPVERLIPSDECSRTVLNQAIPDDCKFELASGPPDAIADQAGREAVGGCSPGVG